MRSNKMHRFKKVFIWRSVDGKCVKVSENKAVEGSPSRTVVLKSVSGNTVVL